MSYSAYKLDHTPRRAVSREMLGAFHWLDLTPKGRNEDSTMNWLRLHDEYETTPLHKSSCCA